MARQRATLCERRARGAQRRAAAAVTARRLHLEDAMETLQPLQQKGGANAAERGDNSTIITEYETS